MDNQTKCQLGVCNCKAQAGRLFCSDDCMQAAAQGVERDFCQCAHAGCAQSLHNVLKVDMPQLDDPFHLGDGEITIAFNSKESLIRQLLDLAAGLSSQVSGEDLQARPELIDRRPSSSEKYQEKLSSRSA